MLFKTKLRIQKSDNKAKRNLGSNECAFRYFTQKTYAKNSNSGRAVGRGVTLKIKQFEVLTLRVKKISHSTGFILGTSGHQKFNYKSNLKLFICLYLAESFNLLFM